jgi:sugar phosphate permease
MPARDIRLIVSGFLLALFSSFGQTFFIALFSGEIRAEFGLTHGAFGSIYSLATLVSGLLMLWIGAALDRVSLRSYAGGATAALAGACVLLAMVEKKYLLLLALFVLRLAGQGMMSHASLTGMARAFTRNRGKAIAAATLGHPAGEAVLPIIAVTAAAALGWRSLWIIAAVILAVAFVALIKLLDGPSDAGGRGVPTGRNPAGSRTRAEMLRDVRFYLIMPALIGPSFIVTGLFFHQVHLTEVKGWELSWFATCFAAYAASSTAGLMITGVLIDRLGAVRLMPIYLLPLCLGCAILALGSHDLVALAFMSLAGMTSGAAVTVVTAMWAEVYGLGHLGAIRALGASLSVVSSALGPAAMGWLIDDGISMEAIAFGAMAWLASASLSVAMASLRPAAPRSS